MIVEGLSMAAVLKEKLKPILAPQGLAGKPVAIAKSASFKRVA
jgi:hypothetical protein